LHGRAAADSVRGRQSKLKAIVLYYPSVRDEPETSHRPRHAFHLARTLKCASLVFCGGKDYIATPAIRVRSGRASPRTAAGRVALLSDANHGFRHPDNDGFQPHLCRSRLAIVTDFLQRRV